MIEEAVCKVLIVGAGCTVGAWSVLVCWLCPAPASRTLQNQCAVKAGLAIWDSGEQVCPLRVLALGRAQWALAA